MDNQDSLAKRGRTLEDEFFHRVDQKLAEEIRAKMAAENERKQLEQTCGLRDTALLEAIVALGIGVETMVGLSLVPLVQVAWADGVIDRRERDAVLKAADTSDCPVGSAAYQLLDHWLAENPPASLFEAWKYYISALKGSMPPENWDKLRDEIVSHTRKVATAAGGILGIGSISKQEDAVFAEVKSAFE